MIEHVYNNVIIADLKDMDFDIDGYEENEEVADKFCKSADELSVRVNSLLNMSSKKGNITFCINGVNIFGNNLRMIVLTPDDFSYDMVGEIAIRLYDDNCEEIALFFLDTDKKYAFRHSLLGLVSVYELDKDNNHAETD